MRTNSKELRFDASMIPYLAIGRGRWRRGCHH